MPTARAITPTTPPPASSPAIHPDSNNLSSFNYMHWAVTYYMLHSYQVMQSRYQVAIDYRVYFEKGFFVHRAVASCWQFKASQVSNRSKHIATHFSSRSSERRLLRERLQSIVGAIAQQHLSRACLWSAKKCKIITASRSFIYCPALL